MEPGLNCLIVGLVYVVRNRLEIAIQARKEGFKGCILPKQNAREAAIVSDLDVYGVESINEVVDFFNDVKRPEVTVVNTREEFLKAYEDAR